MDAGALPERARVVIIGGGIIGTSIAYHLGRLGWSDTLLVERDQLTSGTTWHAAGLMVTFGSMSETSTELRRYTRDLYARLESETGLATGFSPVGFIEVAADEGRLEEFRRIAAFNRHCGVEVHEISPSEIAERFPIADVSDVLAGFFVPGDGRVNPVDCTMSLAKGARNQGVTIVEGTSVEQVLVERGTVVGVRTDRGDIACEYVVNCAGMWARQLGERNGVTIANQAAEHYYLITEPVPGVERTWPVLEDPSRHGYYREEVGGLMIGLFEPVCAPWNVGMIPADGSFLDLAPDWDRMGPFVEHAMSRVPIAADVGIKKFFCGPESFTPDLAPIVGPAPEVRNYFVCAGLNSIGILTGGGWGRVVAEWIATGDPGCDVTGVHVDRLQPFQRNPEYRAARTVESLGMVYQCHYPGRSMSTARGAKQSPLHERLVAQRACFRDVSGWEGADWYAPAGVEPVVGELTWARPHYFEHWAAEHRACRDAVVVMDMSFMTKLTVEGRDAGRVLERLSANRVDGPPNTITYTPWLNERGTLEADLTVTKLDDEHFFVVASDTAHRHVLTMLQRAIVDGDHHAFVADVTSAYAQINVQGPRARDLLGAITTADVSNAALPFRGVVEIDVGLARVRCIRITYVGELGYELFVPTEQAVHVYDRIVAAGGAFGLRHAGLKALSSLRLEKGYRDYGHDIDNTDSVQRAGLGFTVAIDKPGGFVGRDAVIAERAAGPVTRRLVSVQLADPGPLLVHGEVVYADGHPVGYVRAASYGHTLGGAVGLAMVDLDAPVTEAQLVAATWAVDVVGRRVPAIVSSRPLYDPTSARVVGV